ncbi:MAG: hypothetical protein KAQ98_11870 [Bacteriovoracaceae bacterium]|nr:hypothetical protein [Bacteriovoracaceae bacterium]
MKIKNNPTGCQQLELANVSMHRHMDCSDYDDCLDVAVEHDWQSFNCLGCSQFESEVFVRSHDEIIEEVMDFLKEHELPQKNTVYDVANCATLVKESIKRLYRATNASKKEHAIKKNTSRADKDQVYNRFLEEWNQRSMIQHKKITTRMKKAIDKVLKNADYPLDEVFKAFDNYSKILTGSDYFWSYKWTMEDFLNRGLHKFVDEAQPFDNNKKEVKPVSNNPYMNFSCGGA